MARKFFVLLLAAALALAGCGAPDTRAEQAGNDGGERSPAKEKPRAERDASDERPPRGEGETGADKPEPEPRPQPAPEPKPESANGSESQPKPSRPPEDATASASASSSASVSASASGDGHDATVTVSRGLDGDTVEISSAVYGNEEVRLIGMERPRPGTRARASSPTAPKPPYSPPTSSPAGASGSSSTWIGRTSTAGRTATGTHLACE